MEFQYYRDYMSCRIGVAVGRFVFWIDEYDAIVGSSLAGKYRIRKVFCRKGGL